MNYLQHICKFKLLESSIIPFIGIVELFAKPYWHCRDFKLQGSITI